MTTGIKASQTLIFSVVIEVEQTSSYANFPMGKMWNTARHRARVAVFVLNFLSQANHPHVLPKQGVKPRPLGLGISAHGPIGPIFALLLQIRLCIVVSY